MSGAEKARRGAGRGVLFVITVLLLGSGIVRLGSGTGLAVARGVGDLSDLAGVEQAPESCGPDPAIAPLFAALQAREARVAETEKLQAERGRKLAQSHADLSRQITELNAAEAALRATIALAEGAAESDLSRLTAVYESMKPKDAAALFQEMAPDFAAGFLGRMRPDSAASVLAGMPPEQAYSMSVLLAARNVGVPTE
jgi:flagellar motility protein MotE (MotC chaperone)